MNPHASGTTTGVPVRVAAALADLDQQYTTIAGLPHGTAADAAARSARLAVVCARRAGWWRVLERWTYHHSDLHLIYGRAVIAARRTERDQARFWRDLAADWRARANGRPDSGLWAMWDGVERGAVA